MYVETHVAGLVEDGGIRMGCSIVEEVDSCFGSGLHAVGLGSSEAAEGYEHGVVDGSP